MDLNFSAFREPRGVMRVLHFIFSISAFATITGYSGYVLFKCESPDGKKESFDYPFELYIRGLNVDNCTVDIVGDYSSDAKYFVATGVLSMLYSLAISVLYIKFDDAYKRNTQIPLIDFVVTVIFGVLWLSSSAAWANGLTGLKGATEPVLSLPDCSQKCSVTSSNFSTLNISVILGFLNFFLWAADLWFLYKETAWFQANNPPQSTSGV